MVKMKDVTVPQQVAKQSVIFGRIPPVGVVEKELSPEEHRETRWGIVTKAMYSGPYRVFRCRECGIAYGIMSPDNAWPEHACPNCGYGAKN